MQQHSDHERRRCEVDRFWIVLQIEWDAGYEYDEYWIAKLDGS